MPELLAGNYVHNEKPYGLHSGFPQGLLLSLSSSQIFHKAAELYSIGRGTDAGTGFHGPRIFAVPVCPAPPGHVEGVTSDISLVLDEWRARVAELHLPEFRNERFPCPRQIYNQG